MSGHFKGKVNGLGAVVPVNSLNGRNQPSSRLVRSSPPRPLPSPPPAKRKKIEENSTHTQARFALALDLDGAFDRPAPRKRSFDNNSDSQQTLRSQPSNSRGVHLAQPNVSEYRNIENFVKAPSRKRIRRDPSESADRISLQEPDMDSDGDVECIEAPEQATISQTRTQNSNQKEILQPITTYASRFGGDRGKGVARVNHQSVSVLKLEKVVGNMERKSPEWRNGKLKNMDSSPDELAPEAHDMREKVPTKRPVTPSPSLSKRGDIAPTKFSTSSHVRPSSSKQTASELVLDRATKIISSRLLIIRAVSGRYKYDVEKTSTVDECFLKLRDMSYILHPTDLDGNILKQFAYLTVNLKKITAISISSNPNCRVVSITRSVDATISASSKLMIEFRSSEDVEHFKGWVEMDREDGLQHKLINMEDQARLDKEFTNLMSKAIRSSVIVDEDPDPEPVGIDIKLIKHNMGERARQMMSSSRPYISTSQAKTKDLMRSYPSALTNPRVTVIPDNSHTLAIQRPVRTTRATFALKSPSLASVSPEPEGWTVKNKGWEKNWRNSLVFPPHGKNRATVDKDDIPRLDEGQFLNDNVLIFYLRYLQHSLEAQRPDLAQRIYFQNTFFYEKLKSSRTSQGINYDSVKTWTSKVDLFTKDYIIVPINEFSHWYVAIIYNAPKFLPSADKQEVSDARSTDTITIEEDIHNSGKVPTALPKSGNLVVPTDVETVISTAQNDLINQLNLTDPEEQKEDIQSSGHEQDVELVREDDDPKADMEQILPSDGGLRQKKTNKRESIGPRSSRRYDPSQPRILTLDSLGITHSPACGCLKQYLIAELKDKKKIEISNPGALGMTARGVPQQTNHCDCGLFLLGYIQQFLKDPDTFVRSLLLRHEDDIPWDLNPSQLRNEIRDLIFKLQKEQQDREDAHKEEKRNRSGPKKKTSTVESPSVLPAKEQVVDQGPSKLPEKPKIPKGDENMVMPKPRSPTPKASHQKNKPSSDSDENLHMPGSFPQSPVVSSSNTRGSSTVADSERPKQTEIPKFVSPLPCSSGDSSPTRPIFVDDSESSPEHRREFTRGHTNPKLGSSPVDILDDLAKVNQRPTSKGRVQEETPTTSSFFAGRHPADRMASARLRQEPGQPQVVVDLSD